VIPLTLGVALFPLFCVRNYLKLDAFVCFNELNATTTLTIDKRFGEELLDDEIVLCVGKVRDCVVRTVGFDK